MVLFVIVLRMLSKDIAYQYFYWRFGWKLQKTPPKIKNMRQNISEKGGRVTAPILKKKMKNKLFFLGPSIIYFDQRCPL